MTKTTLKTLSVAAVAGLAFTLGGCSSATSEQKDVAKAFDAYNDAIATADASKICATMLPDDRKKVEAQSEGKKCEEAIDTSKVTESEKEEAKKTEVDASKINVNGDTATLPKGSVKLGDNKYAENELTFKRIDGVWYWEK